MALPDRARLAAAIVFAVALGCQGAAAQDKYPSRTVHIIVPTPAGGPVDVMARLVANQIAPTLGQSVIIDNRGGAGNTIGSAEAARAAPDGYDALTIAAVNNDADTLKAVLAAGGDARAAIGRDKGSALISAAQLGFVDIVRALIDGKADVDHVNARGWSALITAVVLGNGDRAHTDVVEALVGAGADGDIKDSLGKKAIDYARSRGYTDMVPILQKATGRHT